MPDRSAIEEFEAWFASLTQGVSAERSAEIRPWFASLHQQHGAVTNEVASTAWALERLDVAELAVALVTADLQRTTAWQADVALSTFSDAVEITVDGHARAPATSADPWDRPTIICDIAEIIQEDVSESHAEVWPVCARHDVGLHAEVQAGRAAWWCPSGAHVLADIGLLGM